MKGIILAAGKGTRMYPMTRPVCKPLLPIYDKPNIYYSLSTLLMAGVRDILAIVPMGGVKPFSDLLGDGSSMGVNISYIEQPVQRGIADAFILGADFIGDDDVCLILGDNIFYGPGFDIDIAAARSNTAGATIFGMYVEDPRPFGVVEFDAHGRVLSLEEKPEKPKSHYIVPGLYFYDNRVLDIAKSIKPSKRGELEITDLIRGYMDEGRLNARLMGRGYVWLDAGSVKSLAEAGEFVRILSERQGIEICSPEEIAFNKGWISREQLLSGAARFGNSQYGQALRTLALGKGND